VREPTPRALPTAQPSRVARAVDLYRRTAASRTALALVAANAVPLVGVLAFGWSLWTILAIYWVENGIVGIWNIPRILLAAGSFLPGRTGVGYRTWAVRPMPPLGRVALAIFFAVHYGIFWVVHGVFVLVLPSFLGIGSLATSGLEVTPFSWGDAGPLLGLPGSAIGPFGLLDWSAVTAAAACLFVSHGASFFVNFLAAGEYRTRTAAAQVVLPYGRVVILHMTILFGGFAVAFLGAPILLLVILVVLKTAFDLGLHLREHEGRPVQSMLPAGT